MKVGLYLQTDGPGIGGACFWTACLAGYLARRHEVTIFTHMPGMGVQDLAAHAAQDLSSVAYESLPVGHCAMWHRRDGGPDVTAISRQFDLFVTMTHIVPPLCAAATGVLIVLFPLEPRRLVWPWSDAGSRLSPLRLAREWKHGRRWNRVFESYRVRTALSAFCQAWVPRLWHTDAELMYPPNVFMAPVEPRESRVVSIGRFTAEGVSKHQLELAQLFRTAVAPRAPGWRYMAMGSLDGRPASQRYHEQVLAVAQDAPIDVLVNLPRQRLSDLVGRAKVFWHAAGLTIDEAREPQMCEHFGHVTVEAMSAGCVPVIIGKGGQKEIVRHGTDGFVCQSLDEMAHWTRALMEDEAMRVRMSEAARERAQAFSLERSMARLGELVFDATGLRI